MDCQSEASRIKEVIARTEERIAGQERIVATLILQGFSISAANEKLLQCMPSGMCLSFACAALKGRDEVR